jgi:hypothetical protein
LHTAGNYEQAKPKSRNPQKGSNPKLKKQPKTQKAKPKSRNLKISRNSKPKSLLKSQNRPQKLQKAKTDDK